MKKMAILLALFCCAAVCGAAQDTQSRYTGRIYLYGEQHGVKKIADKELELWKTHYKRGVRHLFLELPYYTAEYLNIWLQEKNNRILEEVYTDWSGTAFHNPHTFEFFIQIKTHCPYTVFHGTDIGHQYQTTGQRFLYYLESHHQKETPVYARAQEIIAQGIQYYTGSRPENMRYRENMMSENFFYELEKLHNADVMGIYGSAHTGLDRLDMTGTVPCMANQLQAVYGTRVTSEDLTYLAKDSEPLRIDTITVGDTTYQAYYYGKQDLNGFKGFLYREFWYLDGAYAALKETAKTGDVLPYTNYPMQIEPERVYAVEYTKADNSKIRLYYRSDGNVWNGQPVTENIVVK